MDASKISKCEILTDPTESTNHKKKAKNIQTHIYLESPEAKGYAGPVDCSHSLLKTGHPKANEAKKGRKTGGGEGAGAGAGTREGEEGKPAGNR